MLPSARCGRQRQQRDTLTLIIVLTRGGEEHGYHVFVDKLDRCDTGSSGVAIPELVEALLPSPVPYT